MSEVFSPQRFEIARLRGKMSLAEAAKRAGLSPKELRRILDSKVQPRPATITAIAEALDFPRKFFLEGDEDIPVSATFRSQRSMTERERGAGLAAGPIARMVCRWATTHFEGFPDVDIPDLTGMQPESAAAAVRELWGLGERPIGNIVRLLESRGVRVFSLCEETLRLNAFALWLGPEPYIFLNSKKSAEASRFDAAHELGHLCLHRDAQEGKEIENEANAFASSFLMPRGDVLAKRVYPTLGRLIEAKGHWGVSLAALVHRYRELKLVPEERARFLYIEMSRNGYLKNEPVPRARDQSAIWPQIIRELWRDRKPTSVLAAELNLPARELEALILFGGRSVYDKAEGAKPLQRFRVIKSS